MNRRWDVDLFNAKGTFVSTVYLSVPYSRNSPSHDMKYSTVTVREEVQNVYLIIVQRLCKDELCYRRYFRHIELTVTKSSRSSHFRIWDLLGYFCLINEGIEIVQSVDLLINLLIKTVFGKWMWKVWYSAALGNRTVASPDELKWLETLLVCGLTLKTMDVGVSEERHSLLLCIPLQSVRKPDKCLSQRRFQISCFIRPKVSRHLVCSDLTQKMRNSCKYLAFLTEKW